MKQTPSVNDQILRIKAGILAFVMAVMCGGIIFIMTAWLLIKGGPFPGYHLRLLGEFLSDTRFPGRARLSDFLWGAHRRHRRICDQDDLQSRCQPTGEKDKE
ncbi:MAG: hypothetical protein H6629_23970 [Calditrichae bacterium]|nr:hypothetical protein [Calditrichia bacterium]